VRVLTGTVQLPGVTAVQDDTARQFEFYRWSSARYSAV